EPEKAISSFREYLRQARDLTPDQRAQVEGYVHEMEELQRRRAADAAGVHRAPPPPPLGEVRVPPSARTEGGRRALGYGVGGAGGARARPRLVARAVAPAYTLADAGVAPRTPRGRPPACHPPRPRCSSPSW